MRSRLSRDHGWAHANAVRSVAASEKRSVFVGLIRRGFAREWAMSRVGISERTARRYLNLHKQECA